MFEQNGQKTLDVIGDEEGGIRDGEWAIHRTFQENLLKSKRNEARNQLSF